MNDLPYNVPDELVVCSMEAAARYRVPAHLLLAVATQEGGRPGARTKNANGSVDIGALQFNSHYLRMLAPYGIKESHVAAAGCYPYHLAAWRIRGHLARDRGDIWTRAANYHSRTPRFNQAYRQKLITRATAWSAWLVRWNMPHSIAPKDTAARRISPAMALPYVARTLVPSAQ